MNDEQEFLASAYLDGAVTDEERARAEADPDVMAAVEQLRELRRALAAVDPPDPARRDAAINAALDAVDARAKPAAPPTVSSIASRRASSWYIGAAAAALVLVVAGGILATRGTQGDDNDAGGAAATAQDAGGGVEEAPGTTGAPEAETRSAQDSAGTSPGATTGAAATSAAPAATTLNAAELPPADVLLQLARRSSPTSEQTPKCNGGRFLGRHVIPLDGKNTRVEIFYNRRAGEYIALDAQTCEPVISTPAP